MDEWNSKVHQKNGLIKRVKNSLYNEYRAENETILFLKKWVPNKISPICGNSVSQDRRFLFKYMPNLENYFHYRSIDVSTLKELAYRWNFKVYNKFKKKQSHKAIEDIYESVKELDFYRKNFLNIDKNCF